MKTLKDRLPEDETLKAIIKQIRLAKRNSKLLIRQMDELFEDTNTIIGSTGEYPAEPSTK